MALTSSRSDSLRLIRSLDEYVAVPGLSSNCTLFGVRGELFLKFFLLAIEVCVVVVDMDDFVGWPPGFVCSVAVGWLDCKVVYPIVVVGSSVMYDVD